MPPPGDVNKPLTKSRFKRTKLKGKGCKVKRLRSQSRAPGRRKLDVRGESMEMEKEEEEKETRLTTRHTRKILRRNPRANMTLSGKKKRKLMKAQLHAERELNEMAVEVEVKPRKAAAPAKSKKVSKKATALDEDVEMMDT